MTGIAHEDFNAYLNNNIGLIKLAELPVNETGKCVSQYIIF